MTRNGGKQISIKNLKNKCESARKSAEKLIEAGLQVEFIDTSRIRMNEMNMIIEKELMEKSQ